MLEGRFFLSFVFFFRPRSFCSVLVHVCLDRRTDEEYRITRWTWGSFVLYIITLYHSCFRIFSIESNKTIIHITKNSIELQEKVMNQGKSVLTQMKGRKHPVIKNTSYRVFKAGQRKREKYQLGLFFTKTHAGERGWFKRGRWVRKSVRY